MSRGTVVGVGDPRRISVGPHPPSVPLHMRNVAVRISAAGILLATLAAPVLAQTGSASVSGTVNLSKASTNAGTGDGIAPTAIALAAGTGRILQLGVSNTWGCQYATNFSADGLDGAGGLCVGPANINSVGKVSGYATPGRSMSLSALFLGSSLPASAPANYNYGGAGAFNLATYSGISSGQVFFVGDGYTNDAWGTADGSGVQQQFLVPDDAEFLYFGVMDGCAFVGNPDCYYDNAGSISVRYNVSAGTQSVVPEPSTYALMSAGLAGLMIVARRRRRV